ncbi:HEAT repeat domain-containing protein [Streptomyces sp. NPDC002599]|uniref:HEAT repeat domain-containing protein n=1 Tax=Streptomyces sp. NPDC002599 TaxID=3154421 RepID=UPI00331CD1F8
MRSSEELGAVDWRSLDHAYGDGSDIPDWIRALYGDDADRAGKAMSALFNGVLHQGTVYPATVAVVPFLAHAALHTVHHRADALAFLAGAGGQGPQPWPGDEEQGCAQVAAEVPGLLHLLGDDDPQVRRQAVRVARRATGKAVPAAVRALATSYETDPIPAVRAEALIVLTRLDPDPRSVQRRLHGALTDPVAAVRAAGALELLEQARAPYLASLVETLANAGGDSEFPIPAAEFFPGVGETDQRVTAVLAQDADATLAVARTWIAQGDIEGRGTRRARDLSDAWRDRENETIALLTAALPYEKQPWEMSELFWGIECWLPDATDPDPALGDHLLPYTADTSTSCRAQLALGSLGDQRLLTHVPDPDPAALAALAARTHRAEHQHLALRHTAAHPNALLAALTPEAARTLLPDLKNLLRRCPTVLLARRFGDWDLRDAELLGLLENTARNSDGELATAAAVTAALLGSDPHPALHLLEHRLRADGWSLEEASRLGPPAGPLLPLIEGYLDNDYEWTRARAAETHWRITGDPSTALPILTTLAGPLPVGIHALKTLLQIGQPLPPGLQPHLEHWATSPRRLVLDYGLPAPDTGLRHLDNQLRDIARQLLTIH